MGDDPAASHWHDILCPPSSFRSAQDQRVIDETAWDHQRNADWPKLLTALIAGADGDSKNHYGIRLRDADEGIAVNFVEWARALALRAKRLLVSGGNQTDANALLAQCDHERQTVLILALVAEHRQLFDSVLRAGANINARAPDGVTPLHVAAIRSTPAWCLELLDLGALIGATDNAGNTPLHLAAQWGNADICAALVRRGAKLDAENAMGWTPIQTSIMACHPSLGEELRAMHQTMCAARAIDRLISDQLVVDRSPSSKI